MRMVEFVTIAATLVGLFFTIRAARRKRRLGEPSPLQRWRDHRARQR